MGDQPPKWGQFASMGLEVAGGALLGYLVGHWLDQKYGWGSRGTLFGVMIGVAAGMYLMIKEALRMNKD